MSVSVRNVVAVLIVAGALAASIVVWDYGRVDIGMTVERDTHGMTDPPGVIVRDVTPDGNAARNGFYPLMPILDLTTTSGAEVERGARIGRVVGGWINPGPLSPWQEAFGSVGAELTEYGADYRPPTEPVASANIARAVAGAVTEDAYVAIFSVTDRGLLEDALRRSIWLLAVGLGAGLLLWRVLVHGVAGATGREHAVLLGAAAATPFILVPVVQVGTPIGVYAGFLVPAGLALIFGVSLALRHPDRAWRNTGLTAALVAAGLLAVVVIRYMTSPSLDSGDRVVIYALMAAITVAPVATMALDGRQERASHLSLALVPVAALGVLGPATFDPFLPLLLLVALVGWQALPLGRVTAVAGRAFGQLRPSRAAGEASAPTPIAMSRWRDRLLLALFGLIVLAAIMNGVASVVVIGAALAGLVGLAIRRGFLGETWTDAAVPLAVSTGIPVVVVGFPAWDYGGAMGWAGLAAGLGSLGVAHVLAIRHDDARWRARLFLAAVAVLVLVALVGGYAERWAIVLAGLIPLVPGLPAAFAEDRGEQRALTARLETLAVTLTPGAAATALFPETNGVLLGAWLVAVAVWRQFTLNPLLGLARRTELQRDLAVAAAETERARLAADLHDDALQQLTMLVRTLDEGGHTVEADEAREVATKLRSIVGDLRLPMLDDLGAGAALEWLVERVEPLAGGSVKLERSDETRPPANVELAVFRVAQEALTNAIKHGRPPIAVRYDVRSDGRVTLAIDDAGEGIGAEAADEAPKAGHFGLANMQQRAEQIGALLDVRRWPAGGTRVALEWRPQGT
jgi:signal transduction histidine kinase